MALSPIHLVVETSGDGCGEKVNVVVVSEKFEGLPLLKQHRLVNEALAEEMETIHALSIKTFTPGTWKG